MNNKQEIAIIFMKLERKIANVFLDNEDEINSEVNDLLTEITMKLGEVMEIVLQMKEVEI